jgi:hypothetical protein
LNDKNENFELKRKESYSEEPQATDSFIEVWIKREKLIECKYFNLKTAMLQFNDSPYRL